MCSVAVMSESGRTFALMLSSFEAKDVANFRKLPEISVNLHLHGNSNFKHAPHTA